MRKGITKSTLTVVAIALASLSGCERQGPGATAAPSGSAIRITRVSPEISSQLNVGDRVDLEVATEYTLNAESGVITLVVQSGDNSSIANQSEVVTRGSGSVTLKSSFTVPETNAIMVFTPLSAQGQAATSTVDTRAYKVGKK
jgi:hypothetical protein